MRGQPTHVRMMFGGSLTPVVKTFLWVNGWIFLGLALLGQKQAPFFDQSYATLFLSLFALSPSAVIDHWALWQPLTYMFVHFKFVHLLFNMLALWWFGTELESHWGSKTFFRYYLWTGIGAGITSIALFDAPTIGASGAIYGLLLAYGMLFPNRVLYLYFVIPVKAKYCVMVFALIEVVAMIGWEGSGINHLAHLGGIVFGLFWFLILYRKVDLALLYRFFRRRRLRRKFRLIRKTEEDQDPLGTHFNPTIH